MVCGIGRSEPGLRAQRTALLSLVLRAHDAAIGWRRGNFEREA
jgi:hypothetical protein